MFVTVLFAPLGDEGWAACPDTDTIWINEVIPIERRMAYVARAWLALDLPGEVPDPRSTPPMMRVIHDAGS